MEHGDIGKALGCLVTNEVLPGSGREQYEHIMAEIFVPDLESCGPDAGRARYMEKLTLRTIELAKLIKEHAGDSPILIFTIPEPSALGCRYRLHGDEGEIRVRQTAQYDLRHQGVRVVYDLAFQKAEVYNDIRQFFFNSFTISD